jgi:predicted nucleic-acid-binding protein
LFNVSRFLGKTIDGRNKSRIIMFNIKDLKSALSVLPLSEEIKQNILVNSEVMIEFRKFMAEKYQISEEEADAKINSELTEIHKSNPYSDMVPMALLAIEKYASEQGFEKSSELKDSVKILQESLLIIR